VRRAAKKDDNQPPIVDALRRAGADVKVINHEAIGDLLVGWMGRNILVEVKGELGPNGGSSGRDLTPAQEAFRRLWRKGDPPWVIRSPIEAQAMLNHYAEPDDLLPRSSLEAIELPPAPDDPFVILPSAEEP
jgi:hypothetical protein